MQQRLRELLVAKRRDLAEQIAELQNLSGELARVAARLDAPAATGACDDSCAWLSEPETDAVVTLSAPRGQPTTGDVAIVCTLDAAAMPERLAAWRALAAHVVERVDVGDGFRMRFAAGVTAGEVADLAAKEQRCCSFMRFSVGIADGETTLTVTAPPEARELIDALVHVS